jgi:hypothetical protein
MSNVTSCVGGGCLSALPTCMYKNQLRHVFHSTVTCLNAWIGTWSGVGCLCCHGSHICRADSQVCGAVSCNLGQQWRGCYSSAYQQAISMHLLGQAWSSHGWGAY